MVAEINGGHGRAGPAPAPVRLGPGPSPRALRDGIATLQDGRCFYCPRPPGPTAEADHFILRVRCGIDAIENLVLADQRCNNDKRDLLPGPRT
jgi:5-methylcytosine-specific restriction endonuclease McrA